MELEEHSARIVSRSSFNRSSTLTAQVEQDTKPGIIIDEEDLRKQLSMMNCLLNSRIEVGFESNSEILDEDVNMYLCSLLESFKTSPCGSIKNEVVSAADFDVFALSSQAASDRERFIIYKTNADCLLMSATLFPGLLESITTHRTIRRMSEKEMLERAATYYALASSYVQKCKRARSALAKALLKLSRYIDKYSEILINLAVKNFKLMRQLSPGEEYHLSLSVESMKHEQEVVELTDRFLDAYGEWMKAGTKESRARVVKLAGRLRKLKPDFKFKLPKEPPNSEHAKGIGTSKSKLRKAA
jgi:hypothetical protein